MKWLAFVALFCAPSLAQVARNAAAPAPGFSGGAELDAAINEAIRQDKLPGGVLLVGHAGKIVYRKAYGYRSVVGAKEPMTVDTIFDLASLTKIVATTSAMMRLSEQGRLDLDAPV